MMPLTRLYFSDVALIQQSILRVSRCMFYENSIVRMYIFNRICVIFAMKPRQGLKIQNYKLWWSRELINIFLFFAFFKI